jgi:hypothetical protein
MERHAGEACGCDVDLSGSRTRRGEIVSMIDFFAARCRFSLDAICACERLASTKRPQTSSRSRWRAL